MDIICFGRLLIGTENSSEALQPATFRDVDCSDSLGGEGGEGITSLHNQEEDSAWLVLSRYYCCDQDSCLEQDMYQESCHDLSGSSFHE